MTLFSIFLYSVAMVVLGYMIGHEKGNENGYIDGRSEMIDDFTTKGAYYKDKR